MSVEQPEEVEVAVVGAGPAGLSAAIESARAGARTVVFDENPLAGGQLSKQIHRFFGSQAHHAGARGFEIGGRLLGEATEVGVEVRLDTVVWGAFQGPLLGCCHSEGGGYYVRAQRLVLATGATERALVFPGWTLPGVMGAGAAQTLTNIYRVLPGRRVLMVGAGNVGLSVAYQLTQAGAEVAAVVEAAPLIGGYDVHAAKLRRLGVPILLEHRVLRAEGREGVERAVVARCNAESPLLDTEQILEVDLICLAVGLGPQFELAHMLGTQVTYDARQGDHFPAHNELLETSLRGVYVAGDLSSIGEATVAMEQGRIAGTAAARSLGRLSEDAARQTITEARQRLAAVSRVGPSIPPRCQPIPTDASGPVPVVECYQEIPCNPCEEACPTGAIKVGEDISAVPRVEPALCNGCGRCVRVCPGLAIFLVDQAFARDEAAVTIPWELLPLPEPGQQVTAADRDGAPLCGARVVQVRPPHYPGDTATVTIAVPHPLADAARGLAVPR